MRILFVTATYPPSANGVAITTERTVRHLRTSGHRVAVIGPATPAADDGLYYRLPTFTYPGITPPDYPLSVPFLTTRLRRFVNGFRPEIVHVHHPFIFGQTAIAMGRLQSVPVVFTYHTQYDAYLRYLLPAAPEWLVSAVYTYGVLSVLRRVAAVVAPAEWLAVSLRNRDQSIPVHTISTAGLEQPYWDRAASRGGRSRYGIRDGEQVFITVSRLSPEKNIAFLLESFRIWQSKHPQGTYLIIGDGTERNRLEALADRLHVNKRVRFLGKVANADLSSYLSVADAFLYASTSDTVSVNCIEAMSARLPIIAVDHETLREIVTDGNNGILVRRTPEAFAAAMETVSEYRVRRKLGTSAALSARRYTVGRLVSSLTALYEATVAEFRPS